MDQQFKSFVQKWLSKNVSDIQRISVSDWLMGRNQNDLIPSKTLIKKDNNILETPYCVFNRYKVEFLPASTENLTT